MSNIVGLIMVVLFYLVLLAICLVNYILSSIGLYTIAKRRGLSCPGLAWVPIANCWTVGGIAQEYDSKHGIKRNWKMALLIPVIIVCAAVVLMIVTLVMMIALVYELGLPFGISAMLIMVFYFAIIVASATQMVINYICYFKIFESTVPEKALAYMLVSSLVPLGQGICLFSCRNSGYSNIYTPPMENYVPVANNYVPPAVMQ